MVTTMLPVKSLKSEGNPSVTDETTLVPAGTAQVIERLKATIALGYPSAATQCRAAGSAYSADVHKNPVLSTKRGEDRNGN